LKISSGENKQLDKIYGKVYFIGEVESLEEKNSIIKIYDKYCQGLYRLAFFSHIIILYWFHERDNDKDRQVLKVTPKMHKGAPEVGVFTSRSPSRPNPLGISVAKIVSIDKCNLIVQGLDAKTGSPIVDIKPYLPSSDRIDNSVIPDYMNFGPAT